ncbi:hypothetical protein ASG29_08315 [Sphingomonas sp. Leaf412]|uniref:type II toxin-antitoxin system VapC family toxin n=1 Tax=Sphingomonas sp. Leaf412 TaxID=1736370 RepID=UPI0006F9F9E0|nr:hypothetical protein [Sphingomonas sp. Leaf412]KQT31882.1 hypothetical protein ASG29_08315 [Sphingomonas sp. Leaf412]
MVFELAASLRRLKPEKRTPPLVRRPDDELTFADDAQAGGPPLLLDTTVYIDVLQNRAPQAVKDLLLVRQVNHSSIAVGELTHLFGRLDPSHHDTGDVLTAVRGVIEDIPRHRLFAPSVAAVAEAGIVTGVVARLRGLPKADRQPFMNDATLLLQALENGSTLLSRNIGDMDLIQQIVPAGRVLLYRQRR